MFEELARNLGGVFQRSCEPRSVVGPRRPNHLGKERCVSIDQPAAGTPYAHKLPRQRRAMDELLKERGGERGCQRRNTPSPNPGTMTRHLVQELLKRIAQSLPRVGRA